MNYPPSRGYHVHVERVRQLSPHFTRITFTGDQLQHFGHAGFDQRIKILFPHADGSFVDCGMFDDPPPSMGEWYLRWRQLPDAQRNVMRTYTVRAVRPEAAEVDVDFVLHGVTGPASAWAIRATPGDQAIITGPDGRATASLSGGVEWRPGSAREVLLAGDETAAPAICAIVESLGERHRGHVLIEVPTSEDVIPLETRADLEIRWLGRDGAPHGSLLSPEVRLWGDLRSRTSSAQDLADPDPDAVLWDSPPEAQRSEYAWLAGESGVITSLRRHLVREAGIDRSSIAFMGYWRAGRPEN